MFLDKRFLRTSALAKLAYLHPHDKKAQDEAILARLYAQKEYQDAHTIFAYVGMPHEIETRPLLRRILADGKILALPLCITKQQMEARIVTSLNQLQKNAYGMESPLPECEYLAPEKIDLAIIPCLAATTQGDRIGHGGGYYDRYLAEYLPPSVILCRECCLLQQFPHEPHDIQIPWVISEKEIYRK